jgi:hypothetical protein
MFKIILEFAMSEVLRCDYKYSCLPGCDTMYFGLSLPSFRKCFVHLFKVCYCLYSTLKADALLFSETLLTLCQATSFHIQKIKISMLCSVSKTVITYYFVVIDTNRMNNNEKFYRITERNTK